MMTGKKLNITENSAVLNTALRAKEDEEIFVDGKNVVPDVYEVRRHIKEFSEQVRSGAFVVFLSSSYFSYHRVQLVRL